ncbi:ubiquitin elongating factor core-domain-containing protein [Sphaerosporella brunnea]|uniref:Ubiquitin elongating factor core-domain-containing protein n=1 Tax=Sphaerosporella brunnea TaxID=1250544 RepID=A0A5J5F3B8_9PEZI|nr:ubiquitin elongating factor core-domain-containing protein [Sphaerosporella brunnea]
MSSAPEADADEIRNKRLARLQALQSQRGRETPAAEEAPKPSPVAEENRQSPRSPAAKPTPTPPPTATPAPPTPTNSISPPPASRLVPPEGGLTPDEAWEDLKLSQIFKVTLRPTPRTAAGGYLVLEGLRKDLEDETEEGKVPHLSVGVLDQLILSICGEGGVVPMDHLIASWKRAMDIHKKTPASRLDPAKIAVLKEAKRMCSNYALYCITLPDMFGGNQPPVRLDQLLLADPEEPHGLPQDMLVEWLAKFDEEPDLVDAFREAFRLLSGQLATMNMSDNYKPYITALGRIAHLKPLADIFVNLPEFLHEAEPQDLEKVMLLGPFFRISPAQPEVSKQYFANAKSQAAVVTRDATNALRMASKSLQEQLTQITTALCKTSDQVRNRVLQFFANILNANKKRVAINVDRQTVSSDGFMANIAAVLTRMCEPFMDASFSKIDRIEVEYFRRNPKLDISDETKLNADDQSSKEFYSQTLEGKNNFITEIFFLCAAAHHYGLNSSEMEHDGLSRDIPEMEQHLQRIQEDRAKYIGTPALVILDRNIERIKTRIIDAISHKQALEVILFDHTLQASSLLFMRYQMVWLLRLVDPKHQYPRQMLSLPLPDAPSEEFNHLPEYLVECVGSIISFVSIFTPEALISTQLTELLAFAVTFLRSSKYIQKATLKSKLVEIIFWGMRPGGPSRSSSGYLGELVHGNQFVLQHLMHALMNFYIEIEKHYYEKFTVRYHISKIIQQLWPNQIYRQRLEQESDHNVDFFVRFVALLLNDVTYVLDNSLTALADIRRLQDELESSSAEFLTQEERETKQKALNKAEKDAQSYMQLGNETVIMLGLFTSTIADAFVQPEIVSRLAGMLDYNLEALVGPKCNSLRVRNPEKYRFNPRALLGEITGVYLNLAGKTAFIEAIARDGRSYKPKTFELAIGVLRKHHLKSAEDMHALAKLAAEVKTIKEREDEEEMELGDIPDEFMDPLMFTLMEDPVVLPTSKTSIDRQTIKAHLLSDATDPFNRSSLKIEDVMPDTELKARIDAWVTERKAAVRAEKAAAAAAQAGEADSMDIDG